MCFSLSLFFPPHTSLSLVCVSAYMFVFVCVCVLAPQCISGDQMTIHKRQFSPSTMWIQLRGSDLVAKYHLTSHYIFFYLFIFNKLLTTQTSEPGSSCHNTIAGQTDFKHNPRYCIFVL